MARYNALELGMGEEPCPDRYTPASTLICPRSKRMILQLEGANKVIVQLGVMDQGVGIGTGSIRWQAEEPFMVSVALGRRFDAVRVRNWKPGSEAKLFLSVA